MSEADPTRLVKIGRALLDLNPLETRGLEILTQASGPFGWPEGNDQDFWAARRNCSFQIREGMLPGTNSVFVRDADEDDLLCYENDLRDEAMESVAKVLGVQIEPLNLVRLNAHPTGNVDVLFSGPWQVVLQVHFRTGEHSDASAIVVNFLVAHRG